LFVHIGDPSSNQATTLESQMIHMIQELFGQTLRDVLANRTGDDLWGGVGTNKTRPKEGGLVGILNEKPFSGLNPNW